MYDRISCCIGDCDAIMKDVKGFDYERAYEAMKTTATNPNYDCLPEYTELGWVPFDKEKESVSKSLEYAYDDYCIAQVAQKLGKTEDYEFFMKRALSYKNLIDPGTKYMRGRDSKGNWRTPFAPIAYQGPGSVNGWGDITEGFTLQYTWYVPHDVQGYIPMKPEKICSGNASIRCSLPRWPIISPEHTIFRDG